MSVVNSACEMPDGLEIAVTGGYGTAVLRLYWSAKESLMDLKSLIGQWQHWQAAHPRLAQLAVVVESAAGQPDCRRATRLSRHGRFAHVRLP